MSSPSGGAALRQAVSGHAPAARLGPAWVRFTSRADGDLGHAGADVTEVRADVAQRRRAVVDLPWTWLRQVHGTDVVRVTAPGAGAGARADGAVTAEPGCALAVLCADCAPVAMASPEGVVAVAHAGWRGALGGVLQRTVAEMRALGATSVEAAVGPCIGAECYAFGEAELAAVESRYGPSVRSTTATGAPALDLGAAVRVALAEAGVERVESSGVCTACSPDHFSWRARSEQQRQAVVVWR